MDYSRYIREVSMAMDGLPKGVASPGRVPEQLLQAAPILKRRRRRYRGEITEKRSIQGFPSRGVNIGEGGHQEGPQGNQEAPWRGLGWGRARDPSGVSRVAPLPSFGDSGAFRDADFSYNFPEFLGANFNSRKT